MAENNPVESRNSRTGGPRLKPVRILFLALLAGIAGYYLSNWAARYWRDSAGAVREFPVMNTYARITIPTASGSGESPSDLADAAEAAIRRVNDLMSPFGDASDIRRLNESPAKTWLEVDPLTWRVVMEALRWHRLSGGAFDPTIGPIKHLFRFDQIEVDAWPSGADIAAARELVGADLVMYRREGMQLALERDGMRLDLGGIAKGFACDLAAEELSRRGVANAMIEIGGELRLMGMKPENPPRPWKTGVRDPRGDGIVAALDLADAAVATSGDYENYFVYRGQRYEHIIDPRTGLPLAEGVASATVVHPSSCLAADALATTMCVLGPEEGRAFLERQALGLFSGGVRVIMMIVKEGQGADGELSRVTFTVNDRGGVEVDAE